MSNIKYILVTILLLNCGTLFSISKDTANTVTNNYNITIEKANSGNDKIPNTTLYIILTLISGPISIFSINYLIPKMLKKDDLKISEYTYRLEMKYTYVNNIHTLMHDIEDGYYFEPDKLIENIEKLKMLTTRSGIYLSKDTINILTKYYTTAEDPSLNTFIDLKNIREKFEAQVIAK